MPDFPKSLILKLQKRVSENALRKLPLQNNLVDFSSNDYLGFSKEIWISERFHQILNQESLKNGATGSRLLSGNHVLYDKLETQLCAVHNSEEALIFNSGYDANLGFFASVPQREDFIFYDEYAHASIRDGIRLSNAKAYKFKHNDLYDLQAKIKLTIGVDNSENADGKLSTSENEIYIVTESVFSMDGDTPDLTELAKYCYKNSYHLIVDEAHAFGVFGNGLCQEHKIEDKVFARIITFGKAMGSHGAAILGSSNLKAYLVNFARSLIYTTALPPHTIASILASYDYLISEKGGANQNNLLKNIVYFKQELIRHGIQQHFIESKSAIQCMAVNGNVEVKAVSNELMKKGFDVKAILSPTVPKGKERLRFCIHAFNTKEEIKTVLEIVTANLIV